MTGGGDGEGGDDVVFNAFHYGGTAMVTCGSMAVPMSMMFRAAGEVTLAGARAFFSVGFVLVVLGFGVIAIGEMVQGRSVYEQTEDYSVPDDPTNILESEGGEDD